MQLTYQVLTSSFHDGTHMTTADLLYPYIFAYRWSTPARADARRYDPYIARATAMLRAGLVGLKVLRVERSELGIGEFKLSRLTVSTVTKFRDDLRVSIRTSRRSKSICRQRSACYELAANAIIGCRLAQS